MPIYRITVKTGNIQNAGTDANVYITLLGTLGTSGEHELDSPSNDFERNYLQWFTINLGNSLGDIKKVRIRHNNKHNKAGWFLDYILVAEEKAFKTWYFPCYRWLAVDEDDRLIDRTLTVQI